MIDRGFVKINQLFNYGNWNKCLFESRDFFAFLEQEPQISGPVANNVLKVISIVKECISNSMCIPHEIDKRFKQSWKNLKPHVPAGVIQELEESLDKIDEWIAVAKKVCKKPLKEVLILFVSGDHGNFEYLHVRDAGDTGFDFCPASWENKTKDAVTNSLKMMLSYLSKKGLKELPRQQDFHLELCGWARRSTCIDIKGASLGLGAAIQLFCKILNLKLLAPIAVTGEITHAPGTNHHMEVLGVEHINKKLKAIFCELPEIHAYIPEDNVSDLDEEFLQLVGQNIFPVSTFEQAVCQIFSAGDNAKYQKLLAKTIKKKYSPDKITPELGRTLVYHTTAFHTALDDTSYLEALDKLWYDREKCEYTVSIGGKIQTASEIYKSIWENNKKQPSFLENQAVMLQKRITDSYARFEKAIRYEIDVTSSNFQKAFQDFATPITEAVITHDAAGITSLSLVFEWNQVTIDELFDFFRTKMRNPLKALTKKCLHNFGYQCKNEHSQYNMTVTRRITNSTENHPTKLICSAPQFFYSLLHGFPKQAHSDKLEEFTKSSDSERPDVFLSVTNRHCLLVETHSRMDFTRSRLCDMSKKQIPDENFIWSRAKYNDLGYWIWLEMLLRLKLLLQSQQLSKKEKLSFYERFSPIQITDYELYQNWLFKWKNIFGVERLYEMQKGSSQ